MTKFKVPQLANLKRSREKKLLKHQFEGKFKVSRAIIVNDADSDGVKKKL